MRIIGLTGGIGTGKSEVSATLRSLGGEIIDADREGHLAYRKDTEGWRRLLELFGESIKGEDGEIDRRQLGQLVFGDPQAMGRLNAAIHPLIKDRVSARIQELADGGTDVAVIDAALFYQAGWDDLTNEVWVVTSPSDQTLARLAAQRGMDEEEARGRIEAQEPPEAIASRADVVIENKGTLEQLKANVTSIWNERNFPRGDSQNGGH